MGGGLWAGSLSLLRIDSASAMEEARFADWSIRTGSYPGLWGGQGAQRVTDGEIPQALTWPAAWLDYCEIFCEGAHVNAAKEEVGRSHASPPLPVGRFAV